MSLHTLARAVIERAVIDYVIPATEKERPPDCDATAESFLFSEERSDDLASWCKLAGLTVETLRKTVEEYSMPWDHTDASTFTHRADTHKKKKVWAQIANEVLKKTGDEGRAVREANAAVHRIKHGYEESH